MAINKNFSVTITNSISEININVISITEDRLENILTSHFHRISRSKDWIGAVALSVTLLIVLVTSEFKDKWLQAPVWKAFFIMLFLASLAYSVYCLYNLIANRDSVKAIMSDIKKAD